MGEECRPISVENKMANMLFNYKLKDVFCMLELKDRPLSPESQHNVCLSTNQYDGILPIYRQAALFLASEIPYCVSSMLNLTSFIYTGNNWVHPNK